MNPVRKRFAAEVGSDTAVERDGGQIGFRNKNPHAIIVAACGFDKKMRQKETSRSVSLAGEGDADPHEVAGIAHGSPAGNFIMFRTAAEGSGGDEFSSAAEGVKRAGGNVVVYMFGGGVGRVPGAERSPDEGLIERENRIGVFRNGALKGKIVHFSVSFDLTLVKIHFRFIF